MLSRYSRSAAGLLSCYPIAPCRPRSSLLMYRRLDVLIRSNSSSSDNTESAPSHYRRKPGYRNGTERRKETKSVPLDVNFLGEPGEIVVVPHTQRRRRTPRAVKNVKNEPSETGEAGLPFFLEELEKEDISLDATVVDERIESVLAPHQRNGRLAIADWEDLRFKLQSSFTYPQLTGYITGFESGVLESEDGDIKNNKINTAVWKPGTSAFLESSPISRGGVADRVAMSQALKGKQLLAERILRDCWQLGIAGEVGQIDIRLPSHSISLLLNSENFSFEELASLHAAKIDVTHSLGLVRITGKQHQCESIREIVYDATARIQEEEIRIYPEGDTKTKRTRAFTPEFLEWVSQTYGVAFQQNSPSGPSKIFYLVENKRNADNARRTLNLAIDHTAPSRIPFSTYLSASEPASVYSVDPEYNTSWFDRQNSWFRWAMSSTQSTEAKALETPYFDKHQTYLSNELLKLLRLPSPDTQKYSNDVDAHETLTASVGKFLFLQKHSFNDETASASQLGSMSLPRTFTTDIPRVTSFLRPMTPCASDEGLEIYRIRLIPSAVNASVFPRLEFEVTLGATDNSAEPSPESKAGFVMRGAKAILAESSVDYLLPENGLDVRFSRNVCKDLLNGPNNSYVLEGSDDIKHTINECLQSIFSRKISSELPVFSQISLPKEVLKSLPESSGTGESNDYITGEYMFMPVNEIRGTRVHRYDFQGQRLNYGFYESGPFLPYRTTDVFLDMDVSNNAAENTEGQANSSDSHSHEFNSFYRAACKLAFELDNTWRLS